MHRNFNKETCNILIKRTVQNGKPLGPGNLLIDEVIVKSNKTVYGTIIPSKQVLPKYCIELIYILQIHSSLVI